MAKRKIIKVRVRYSEYLGEMVAETEEVEEECT